MIDSSRFLKQNLQHQNFLTDVQKLRTDLLTQFKEELDNTRQVMEDNYNQNLQAELNRLEAQHEANLREVKKKQWCSTCGQEAIYFWYVFEFILKVFGWKTCFAFLMVGF